MDGIPAGKYSTGSRGMNWRRWQGRCASLRTVVIGAFDDDGGERLLQIMDDERALCIMPVGRV